MIWLVAALLLFLFQISTILVAEFRRPSKGFAWLFILFLFPLVGFVMYYFLAQEYRQRSKLRRKGNRSAEIFLRDLVPHIRVLEHTTDFSSCHMQTDTRFLGLLQSFPDALITGNNRSEVLPSARHFYERMLQDIERAENHIHMVFYIWKDDHIGRTFQRTLIRKASEGVSVRIVYDGIGSYSTPMTFWEGLKAAGAEVHAFLPATIALFAKRLNYRNHRKIAVIDGMIAYLGGINIGDEYLGNSQRLGYWRDTCLRLQGDAVYGVQHAFMEDWELVSREKLSYTKELFTRHEITDREPVQIVKSGPDVDWDTILEMYFSAFVSAKERIYITTPYFIPDRSISMALKTAALAGVDVRVIIPGVADSHLTLWASLSYVEEMLQTGVRIYRYQKGFMHAKTVVVDRHFASVGTANMDMRSFYSNFEINAALFDEARVNELADRTLQDVEDSEEIRLSKFLERSRFQKGQEAVGRLISPLL